MATSTLAPAKSRAGDALLWTSFVASLAASAASGTVLDGTAKDIATYAGIALALLAGSRIARKPRIKAFLSVRPVLWFLFLFNAAVAAVCGVTMSGANGIMAAAMMGLVSLGRPVAWSRGADSRCRPKVSLIY
ncbi:hypothetical protein [Streptomyces sp. NPDC059893]|uniref:hypothetical protein n=1 Tax=Streptomyces sp. NPDC059893 TaxID=3346990 RepID=UPI00364C9BF1